MKPTSKIAQLPKSIREALNHRLEDGEPAKALAEWLNSKPEVTALLKTHFEGHPISEQDLSAWKCGGFLEWQIRCDLNYGLEECAAVSAEFAGRVGAQTLLSVLKAHFAASLLAWDGSVESEALQKLFALEKLNSVALRLRRREQKAERAALKEEAREFYAHKKRSFRTGAKPNSLVAVAPESASASKPVAAFTPPQVHQTLPKNPPHAPTPAASSSDPRPLKSPPQFQALAKPFGRNPKNTVQILDSTITVPSVPAVVPAPWEVPVDIRVFAAEPIAATAR